MSIFRLWGISTFFILVLFGAGLWIFIAPILIEKSMEEVGSEALGAQVDIESVDLNLFPLRIAINKLEATDPKHPMKNLVEVKKLSFALDTQALGWKKILIDELTLDGIMLNTDREASGELSGGRATEKLAKQVGTFDMPELTQADIKSHVEESDLITVKRINELNEIQKEMKAQWKEDLDKEKRKKRIAALETEFSRLTNRAKENKLNLLADRKAWKKLKKEIDRERKQITGLNDKLKLDRKKISDQIALIKQGPKDDANAIMAKMGLGGDTGEMAKNLIGPQFSSWIDSLAGATNKVPGNDQGEQEENYSTSLGQRVYFKDNQNFPDLLIKKIKLNGKDKSWEITGAGENIGYLPWLIGAPIDLKVKMTGDRKASATINSDWKSEQEMLTKIESDVSAWPITEMTLMQTDQGNWVINSGMLSASLTGKLTLENLDLKLTLDLMNPSISTPEKLTGWQKHFSEALNQQKQLKIDIKAKGSLADPNIKLTSSLDKLFAAAIGKKLQEQMSKLTDKLDQAVTDKVGDLSFLDGYYSNFDQWDSEIVSTEKLLQKLKVKL